MKTLGDLLRESWMGESIDVEAWGQCLKRLRDEGDLWLTGWAEHRLGEIHKRLLRELEAQDE